MSLMSRAPGPLGDMGNGILNVLEERLMGEQLDYLELWIPLRRQGLRLQRCSARRLRFWLCNSPVCAIARTRLVAYSAPSSGATCGGSRSR